MAASEVQNCTWSSDRVGLICLVASEHLDHLVQGVDYTAARLNMRSMQLPREAVSSISLISFGCANFLSIKN
jgi:hypothetical protein